MGTVLFTANELDSKIFKKRIGEKLSDQLLHLPLENYRFYTLQEEENILIDTLQDYTYCIYGSLKNAKYFMKWIEKNELVDAIKNCIHLVTDSEIQTFLEEKSIPAILPREYAKGIDILEFLLRISTSGNVLYPTTDQHTEEIPGLLKELEMAVTE